MKSQNQRILGSQSAFLMRTFFSRQSTLRTTTIFYFLVITLLLILDSPGQFISYFTKSGPSLNSFAQAHQTAIHFSSFFLLAILVCLCFRGIGYFIPTLSLVVYAILTELGQIFLPHRHSDPLDLLANLTGIGCGATLVWIMLHLTSGCLWKRSGAEE